MDAARAMTAFFDAPVRGKNLDDLRRTNLATALGLIHAARSISRADLTRSMGLNRSTIATIVADLEARDLIVIGGARDTKRIGRPSLEISTSDRHVVIAVNPELDATTLGIVAMGGRVLREVRMDHERPPSAREVVNSVRALVAGMQPELGQRHEVLGVALAVPGLVSAVDGSVRLAPHLEWVDEPIAAMLAEALGVPAWAVNDASCGVVAEVLFGAGIGSGNVVYLNGGASGVGGGVVAESRLIQGRGGFGGEIGHTLVRSDGAACRCGSRGCLEAEVTRTALLEAVSLEPARAHELEALLFEAYAQSDDVRALVDAQLSSLAVALRTAVNMLNPEIVVLGGFLEILGRIGGERLERMLREVALPGPGQQVRLEGARLGRMNLLIGAAELAFRPLLSDPAAAPVVAGREHAAGALS
ncbi:putative NBD/HSP70 family sugar kinase [Microbacterium sp. AG1240]|uniref:ROK family transcriptional regulator n=1 Tax=Microbacterium sp. AG1240 TaxID=2183992 RepID=UPI000EB36D06|nr:ROK family transcriptional regulator [Microbacterium sp. AG1240]RKT31722.1 putative NBD/HSP70 family sugar kinase [Microbacterium sp. AG1240]